MGLPGYLLVISFVREYTPIVPGPSWAGQLRITPGTMALSVVPLIGAPNLYPYEVIYGEYDGDSARVF